MNRYRFPSRFQKKISLFLLLTAALALFACGGGSSGGGASPPPPPPPPTSQTITLGFDPPSTYTDGTPITDFAGYILCYGPAQGTYTDCIDVGNVSTYTITLPMETWYFSAKAYTFAGTESGYSNELSVTP